VRRRAPDGVWTTIANTEFDLSCCVAVGDVSLTRSVVFTTFAIVKHTILLIVASTFLAASARAQSPGHSVFERYQQLNWQERDGLPQNTVLAIATTRDGYLWVGTYEGAARFDGVRFTLFNPSTTAGIGNSLLTSLLERRDGTLWLATYGGGVSRLSGGQFTQYTMRDGLSSDIASCLFEDGAGTLWIGTEGGGVNALSQGRFISYTTTQGLPSNLVRAIVDDGHGGLLVGTSRGIARIADGRVSAWEGRADVAHADISMLARARDGSVWVGPLGGGLYRVDSRGVTLFGPDRGLPHARVESLYADEQGRMWVGEWKAGLFRYAPDERGRERFEPYPPADGVPGARVPAIAPGVDHSLWVGTDGGLVRFKAPRVTVYTQRDGLASDFVGDIFEDVNGTVWVDTESGLTRLVNGVFQILTAKAGLADGRYRLARSNATRLPLIRSNAGLARWQQDRFVAVPDVAEIPWDRASAVLEDRSGTLWIGIHDGGLIRVRDGRATRLTTREGLADDVVLSLFEDRQGRLWVGTLRNGVTLISGGQLTSWSMRDGLAANHVKAFHQDAAGTIWIGTHGGGLSRFKDGKFATISARQGLYNDDIFQILEDDDANLWMSCNTGIWRSSLKQLNDVADGARTTVESFAYGTDDGMLTREASGNFLGAAKLRDGSLWFSMAKGIVAIDPRRRDSDPPRVLIEGIAIDREPVTIKGPVRLTPGQENLEIQYTALNWNRPRAMKFRFRLVGLDRDWVEAGTRRTAYYSHLPPGSYTFNVTADNGEGVWDATGKTLAIVVLPRFYQTWWFRATIGSGLLTLMWLTWRYRIVQMTRAQAAQQAFSRQLIESQERERQRIAAELHDSLGQNLLVVRNRALLGAMSQQHEEPRKQFEEIGATVAQTLEEVRSISYNLRPHHLDQLGLTTAIRAMIDQIAESSGIRMSSELDDLDGVFPPADEITIYRIIQESLNNVVKHSKAGEAHVAVHCRDHHVEIVIRDNGQGFAPTTSGARAAHRGGFGLKGLAERVDMLAGTHTIESAQGRGTTVTVRLAGRSPREGEGRMGESRQERGHGE
jgi:signal transduction histidine kinase/ligand-binding sensor domain-containing protein